MNADIIMIAPIISGVQQQQAAAFDCERTGSQCRSTQWDQEVMMIGWSFVYVVVEDARLFASEKKIC